MTKNAISLKKVNSGMTIKPCSSNFAEKRTRLATAHPSFNKQLQIYKNLYVEIRLPQHNGYYVAGGAFYGADAPSAFNSKCCQYGVVYRQL